MSSTTSIGGDNSFGYKELFLDAPEGGKSLNDAIAQSFKDVQEKLKEVQNDPGNSAKMMTLQVAMNALQQVISMTTQSVNSLKTQTEGAIRNIS
ncbi:MAG: hypothetical protein ACKOLA_10400 [Spartobacteria bacterium]